MKTDEPKQLLAERVRRELHEWAIDEKRMFGSIAFMLNGNLLCCASDKGLMVRVGRHAEAFALQLPHSHPCNTRHKMPGFVMIDHEGLEDMHNLSSALNMALHYVCELPPKE